MIAIRRIAWSLLLGLIAGGVTTALLQDRWWQWWPVHLVAAFVGGYIGADVADAVHSSRKEDQ